MKTLFRWAFRALILFIVLVTAALLCKDPIVKAVLEKKIHDETGMDAKIEKIHLGLGRPVLDLDGFKLYNPAEFGGSPFLDVAELHVEVDPSLLRQGKLKIILARLNIPEVDVVIAKDGRCNLDLLEAWANRRIGKDSKDKTSNDGASEFSGIETLNLTLGKVRYVPMQRPETAREIRIGIENQILTNLRTTKQFTDALATILIRRGIEIPIPSNPTTASAATPATKTVPAPVILSGEIQKPSARH